MPVADTVLLHSLQKNGAEPDYPDKTRKDGQYRRLVSANSVPTAISNVLFALQQLGLVGRTVVVEVALGCRYAAVRHADALDLAGR